MQGACAENWLKNVPPVPWMAGEICALTPPADISVTDWADEHRRLTAKYSPIPGRWETSRTPYLEAIQNAYSDPRVMQITIMGPAQSGKSAGELNMIGWTADVDPGPMMIVVPKTKAGNKYVKKQLHPLFIDCEKLHSHYTNPEKDLLTTGVELDTMTITISSANNVDELASDSIRYVFLMEVDKYKEWAAREASPVELAKDRVTTYLDAGAKIVMDCTPTTADGHIAVAYEKSTKEQFFVPCPHCDFYQLLLFGDKNSLYGLKWEGGREADPETVEVRYYCAGCGEAIEEKHRHKMLLKGKWVSRRYQKIDQATGEVTGSLPRDGIHRGFWWNGLYSPFVRWRQLVKEWISAQGKRSSLMNFVNSRLAEVWREVETSTDANSLYLLRSNRAPHVVPASCVALTAGIDMHIDHFIFAVYAWALDYKSHLVDYGRLGNWRDLEDFVHFRTYDQEESGRVFRIWRALLDTGGGMKLKDTPTTRTREAYDFIARKGRDRLFATKGLGKKTEGGMVRFVPVEKSAGGATLARPIIRADIDTTQSKDLFFDRLDPESRQRVYFHAQTGEDFISQIEAEHKEIDPHTGKALWVQDRHDNHYLDASCLAHVAADPEWRGGLLKAFGRARPVVNHIRPSASQHRPITVHHKRRAA